MLFYFHIILIVSHRMNTDSQTEVGTPFGLSPRKAVLLQMEATHSPHLFNTDYASDGHKNIILLPYQHV